MICCNAHGDDADVGRRLITHKVPVFGRGIEHDVDQAQARDGGASVAEQRVLLLLVLHDNGRPFESCPIKRSFEQILRQLVIYDLKRKEKYAFPPFFDRRM